ncbi:glyoxalase [Duganella sp. FT50W]|uniref:Glyoxalase n=1 Tax=Duganella lactea TaxID=2692173 RepID=A0A6L8MS85_9BURK|nr:VOC family protein [Duganella lactea]MYM84895.1 glyoxalase [Duganella lactea]
MEDTNTVIKPTAPTSEDANLRFKKIDHIAIAVSNLDQAITFYSSQLGFTLQRRLNVAGKKTGMISAEMERDGLKFVLCQGTEPESQVSRLVAEFGPGVAHIALEVDEVEVAAKALAQRGLQFDTSVINGGSLKQIFSSRDPNSGMSFEFIERHGEQGFLEENVHELFAQLEKSGAY